MKTFRFALAMLALFAIAIMIACPAVAGPFNRCPVIVQSCPNCAICPNVAAPIVAPVETGSTRFFDMGAHASERIIDRCLLPFNCPNRQPRSPRDEVNITVTPPYCDPKCQPPCVSLPSQPAEEHPFPFGLLILVVVPVVLLASVAAFFIRVGAAGTK